ncbi:MAG: hypothetical protein KDA21_05835 [Phycisphaerales bacterium]|nr:hypothetical protein [Phycisphaerales bacterium]
MRIFFLSIISLLFVGAFLVYMFTYTVRFTEVAVVTTLGEASDNIITEPGLKFKWPSPIQNTTVYDKRVRVMRTRSETMSTADSRQLVVETFMTWRVSDPLAFYQRFRSSGGTDAAAHYENAEEALIAQLRGEMSSVVGRYRMNELFSARVGASRLPDMERDLTGAMQALHGSADASESAYGVEIVSVGVLKIVLPEDVTAQVQDVMKSSRSRIAAEEISAGNAEAIAIKKRAENDRDRIKAVVEVYAAEMRSAGDLEAAKYFAELNSNPELAVFLKTTEFMRQGLGRNLTIILPGSVMRWIRPSSIESFMRGEIPHDLLPTVDLEDSGS